MKIIDISNDDINVDPFEGKNNNVIQIQNLRCLYHYKYVSKGSNVLNLKFIFSRALKHDNFIEHELHKMGVSYI